MNKVEFESAVITNVVLQFKSPRFTLEVSLDEARGLQEALNSLLRQFEGANAV
tara:strand:- start:398 stop:556 length:159 start_codon:yes stop_codon:yes gene_type:complete